jgi:hypothetical protein
MMDERVHASLDGDLPLEDLTPAERAAKAAFESHATNLRADLGRRAPRDVDAAVMRRIHDLGLEPLPGPAQPLARRAIHAIWTAREVRLRVRPVYGMAAAAVLAGVLMAGGALMREASQPTQPVPASAAPAEGAIYVQFRLEAGAATSVALAGSFSDWQPTHRMQQSADGVWTVLLPLTAGVHDYGFIIDGDRWVADPYAPEVDDGFGGVNSRLTVLAPTDRL